VDYLKSSFLVNAENQVKMDNGKLSDDEHPEMMVDRKMTICPAQS
jgi:hypothetical protein